MNSLQRRDSYDWFVCFSLSCIVHLGAMIVIALVLITVDDLRSKPLEVLVMPHEEPVSLVAVEAVRMETVAEEEAVWTPSLPARPSNLDIGRPWDYVDLATTGGGVGGGTGGEVQQASFFGTSSQGDYFVYILDVSPSMNARNGLRLIRAVEELLRSIAQLREDQHFYVIVFGWQTRRMFDDALPTPACVPATLENKQRLRTWLAEIRTISGTDPRRSLQIALDMMPSAVFLLSDGQFNKPKRSRYFGDSDMGVMDIVRASVDSRTPVNAIAFENPASAPAMAEIAETTGGEHRYVPPPKTASTSSRGTTRSSLNHVSSRYRKVVREFRFGDEDRGRPRRVDIISTSSSK